MGRTYLFLTVQIRQETKVRVFEDDLKPTIVKKKRKVAYAPDYRNIYYKILTLPHSKFLSAEAHVCKENRKFIF